MSPKQDLLAFSKNLIHSCFFLYPKWRTTVFFEILQKGHVWENSGSKMLSTKQIVVFFHYQYLLKESSEIVAIFIESVINKDSIWNYDFQLDVVRLTLHRMRLLDSLIINILGQVIVNWYLSFLCMELVIKER